MAGPTGGGLRRQREALGRPARCGPLRGDRWRPRRLPGWTASGSAGDQGWRNDSRGGGDKALGALEVKGP